MANKQRKIQGFTKQVESDENGEIKKTQTNYSYTLTAEPAYVKVYLDTVLYLSDLPKGYNSILWALLNEMSYSSKDNKYGGQIIYINSAMKEDIAEKLKVSLGRINNALSDLNKGKILERVKTGTYRVNPYLFGKGEWKDIEEIRTEVVFNAEGKTIMSEIFKKNKIENKENKKEKNDEKNEVDPVKDQIKLFDKVS